MARTLRSRPALIGAALAVLLIGPWLVREQLAFGDALAGVKQASTQLQVYATSVSMPWHFYPAHFPEQLSFPVVACVLLGLALGVARRDRFTLAMTMVAAFLTVWFSVYRYKETRLVTSVLPFLVLIAARGVLGLPWARLGRAGLVVGALALGGLTVTSFTGARRALGGIVTNGYPSFLDAMAYARARTTSADLIMGANTPQIAWYADRRVKGVPHDQEALAVALGDTALFVATNFERGQPAYVAPLMGRLLPKLDRRVAPVFSDRMFRTAVVPSPALAALLRATSPPAPPSR